jgi:hypothetical protein
MTNMYLDGSYVKNNPSYHVEDSPWKTQQILKMVNMHQLQPNSVCEIGCGAGEILRQLQDDLSKDATFHGYDISPQAIELAQQKANQRLQFYCQDLLLKDTDLYDLLLCIDVFEHVEDYMDFLRRLRQKSVYKIFHIPLDLSVQTVLRETPIVDLRHSVGHLHYFTKETALLTLKDTGYEIVDWFYTSTAIALGKTLKTKIANLPRKLLSSIAPDLTVRIFGRYSMLVLAK